MIVRGLEEFYCPKCGKVFFPAGIWKYKLRHYRDQGVKYYCSYPCFMEATKEREAEKKLHRKRATDENL